jgi:hypothetical protein
MKITKFNISKPEKYTNKNNEEKTMWHNIGTLTAFQKDDGSVSRIIEIPTIGLKANVFPFKEREEKPQPQPQVATEPQEEEINPDDIPF